MLETLLISFLASGGLGYINYYILSSIDLINFDENDSEEKKLSLLLFSIINFIILLSFINYFGYEKDVLIKSLIYSFLITIILTTILSFTLYVIIIKFIKWLITRYRNEKGKSTISNLTVKEQLFDEDIAKPVFIFDLRTHKLLNSGFIGAFNINPKKDYELEVFPFPEKTDLNTYEDLCEYSIKNSKDVVVYINADKELLIFLIKNINSKD